MAAMRRRKVNRLLDGFMAESRRDGIEPVSTDSLSSPNSFIKARAIRPLAVGELRGSVAKATRFAASGQPIA